MWYVAILDKSFALFQYYFFSLIEIIPYFLLMIGFIIIFLFVFKKI